MLGLTAAASDEEVRRVYRELVKRHHPDHNAGSPQSAARFEQIQDAYAAILLLRRRSAGGGSSGAGSAGASADPDIEDRIARIERELADKRAMASKRASEPTPTQPRPAQPRTAQADSKSPQPTPEELGIYSTEDSFIKIIDDAAEQLGERLRSSDAKKQFARRLSDLFGRER